MREYEKYAVFHEWNGDRKKNEMSKYVPKDNMMAVAQTAFMTRTWNEFFEEFKKFFQVEETDGFQQAKEMLEKIQKNGINMVQPLVDIRTIEYCLRTLGGAGEPFVVREVLECTPESIRTEFMEKYRSGLGLEEFWKALCTKLVHTHKGAAQSVSSSVMNTK